MSSGVASYRCQPRALALDARLPVIVDEVIQGRQLVVERSDRQLRFLCQRRSLRAPAEELIADQSHHRVALLIASCVEHPHDSAIRL